MSHDRLLYFVLNWSRRRLGGLQSKLDFDDWEEYREFNHDRGLGRVAIGSCVLGILWGIHIICAIFLFSLLLLCLFAVKIKQSEIISIIANDSIESCFANGPEDTTTTTNTLMGTFFCKNTFLLSLLKILYSNKNSSNYVTIAGFFILLLFIWCIYMVIFCSFHILEFFVTALYNPSVLSYDSFLINHSVAYTLIALTSWTEFWLRYIGCFIYYMCYYSNTNDNNRDTDDFVSFALFFGKISIGLSTTGFILVVISQIIRSLAMITCGESFNHQIQTSKKDNHQLVTHGIYKYLRHPSYVGFYYWSIGLQLLLNNILHTILVALLSLTFFQRRIPYEEESLCCHFPNTYPEYMSTTYIGIPFVTCFDYINNKYYLDEDDEEDENKEDDKDNNESKNDSNSKKKKKDLNLDTNKNEIKNEKTKNDENGITEDTTTTTKTTKTTKTKVATVSAKGEQN